MPEYLAPGVYVEEIDTGSKPIEGVSTSTAGMVGVTERGPVGVPLLVTSNGEYQRLFGGLLNGEFGAYRHLPHAVEGFFTNGGKRAYVVRVLDEENAQVAALLLFDRGDVGGTETLLLRSVPEHSGTAANQPLLYVLDASGATQDTWVRIGDGSASEYRQIAANPADSSHVALNVPLGFGHGAGAAVGQFNRTPDGGFTVFTLVEEAEEGSDELLVEESTAGDAANLAAGQLLEIGGPSGEYHFIEAVTTVGTTRARVSLSGRLEHTHATGSAATVMDLSGGALNTASLELAARAGDRVIFLDDPNEFTNFNDRTDLVVFEEGTSNQEARRIGALSVLSLGVGAYDVYAAGSTVEVVRMRDGGPAIVHALVADAVDGFAAGQTLVVDRGGPNEESLTAELVDASTNLVVFDGSFANAHAAGEEVALVHVMTSDPNTATDTATLDSVEGFAAGQVLVIDPGGANEESLEVQSVNTGTNDVTFVANFAIDHAPTEDVALVHTIDDALGARAGDDTVALDSAENIVAGQTLVVGTGADTEVMVVQQVDAATNQITFTTALANDHAAGGPVLLSSTALSANAAAGSRSIAVQNRLALEEGDLLRIGTAPAVEFAEIASIPSPTGIAPDAGTVVLVQALQLDHATGTEVVQQAAAEVGARTITDASAAPTLELDSVEGIIAGQTVVVGAAGNEEVVDVQSVNATNSTITFAALANAHNDGDPVVASQAANLLLDAEEDAGQLVITDGNGFTDDSIVRVSLTTGDAFYHLLTADAEAPDARLVEIDAALERAHAAGAAFVERDPLIEVQALDQGRWGDRLRISVEDEEAGLVSRTRLRQVIDATHIRLASSAGVEAGTVLELLDPVDRTVIGEPLKVEGIDRTDYTITLATPGLSVAQQGEAATALPTGGLLVRSREFRITVYLLRHPDPAQPSRNDTVLNSEVFRYLSMDSRHSRYVETLIGDIDGELRAWDRRPEGSSAYIRVRDLALDEAAEHGIRLGPEALIDILPNGREQAARRALTGGDDSLASLTDDHYIGEDADDPEDRTGLHSLRNIDQVSIVAIPGQISVDIQDALISHCEEDRYRFAVLDGPVPPADTLTDVQTQRQQFDTKYAALYYPWLLIRDPFPTSPEVTRDLPIPPSGHVVGIYARTDIERGVHKAPANEVVRGITGLSRTLNKREHDILNPYPVNINVIRDFRPNNLSFRVWGARVITSDPDFKYVPVRRLLIFLEESIDEGLQWVVFEPNADPLWARVRRTISDFLRVVWRNGALEGTTEEEAFFVKCDRTTMTQTDIDNGRLICLVGVAPVKPAEYVIIRIGLKTAEAES